MRDGNVRSGLKSGTSAPRERFEVDGLFMHSRALLATAALPDFHWRRINPSFTRILGWTEDEVQAMTLAELIHPQDAEVFYLPSAGRITSDALPAGEHRLRCRDGSYRWISWEAWCDEESQLLYFAGRDLTRRRQTERALQESREHYRHLASIMPAALYTCDNTGTITYYNEQAAQIWGRRPVPGDSEQRFCGAFRLLHPDGSPLPHDQTPMAQAINEGKSFRNKRVTIERPDGSRVDVLANIDPLFSLDGTIDGAVNVLTDVTDRRAIEECLLRELSDMQRIQQVSTRLILEGSTDSLLGDILDAAITVGAADMGNIQLFDDESQVLRIRVQRGFDSRFLDAFAEVSTGSASASSCASACACSVALATRSRIVVDDVANSAVFSDDGSRTAMLAAEARACVSTPLVSRCGRQLGMLSIHWRQVFTPMDRVLRLLDLLARQAADLIERHHAEQELRRSHEELERRVAERTRELQHRADQLARLSSELTLTEQRERRRLAQVLHDHLQQLLVGAKYGLSILARHISDEQREAIGSVQELLDESIEASRSLTVELSPTILHEAGLAAGLRWLARWMEEKHGLQVDLSLDEEAGTEREDLRVLLFQAIRELLFNVVKHAQTNHARLVLSAEEGGLLRVTISDDGVGFDLEDTVTSMPRVHGGFGLFSIRERLMLLGGNMQIQSKPGKGSSFILTAPRKPIAAAELLDIDDLQIADKERPPRQSRAKRKQKANDRIRLLIVDDHAVMRQGLCSLLVEEEDLVVLAEAGDGPQAIALAQQLQPDVVLMDFSMPGMDGVEATRRLKAAMPHVQVIGLSMYEKTDRAEAMLAAGAAAYLTKSGNCEVLIQTIRQVSRAAAAAVPGSAEA